MGLKYSWLVACLWSFDRMADHRAPEAPRETVEVEVDHRRGEKRQQLAEQQSANNGNAQRMTQFRSCASAEGQRHAAEHGRHSGHQDGPETEKTRLIDRF